MNTTLHDDTMAAVKDLAQTEYPVTRPQYELLEEFYETPRWDRDNLWQRLREHKDLLLLFEALQLPLLGGEIKVSDVPTIRGMLTEILAQPNSEQLTNRCKTLAACLDREGL